MNSIGSALKAGKHSSGLLVLMTLICGVVLAQNQPQSSSRAYHILGRCDDYSTASSLKASVYAIVNKNRQKLGDCNELGDFDVLLPASASHLVLEMKAYRTVTLPVYINPGIPENARFTIWKAGEMTSTDSLPKPATYDTMYLLYIDFVDPIDIKWGVARYKSPNQVMYNTAFHKQTRFHSLALPISSGDYVFTTTTMDGQLISSQKVVTRPGLSLVSVRAVRPAKANVSANATINNTSTVAHPDMAVVYFDQSSPDLRPQAKVTLDSIAQILTAEPKLVVTVTGYTDNVGSRMLNTTLSEYRARTVGSYLQQRGVAADRIVALGKGPDAAASPDATESVNMKSRRVVLQLTPR